MVPRHFPAIAGALALCTFLGWTVLGGQDRTGKSPEGPSVASSPTGPSGSPVATPDSAGVARELTALRKEQRTLRLTLQSLAPRGPYLVVDRANNRIYLRNRDSILLEAPASTGSGTELVETVGEKRRWVFDTPGGRFKVLAERPDPIWTKPDWAFLESGEPVPTTLSERREYGSLGEYALDLGDGYMIHGTLYERLLGRSVTHGCVRVGREPLREIARRTGPGSQVFIY